MSSGNSDPSQTRSLFRRAIRTYRRDGIVGVLKSTAHFTLNKLGIKRLYYRMLFRYVGSQYTLSVGATETVFHITSKKDLKRVRSVMGEKRILTTILHDLEPDDVFYDIGANIGIYTCPAAAITTRGQVHSFEPMETNTDRLEQNLDINNREACVHEVVLTDSTGTVTVPDGDLPPGTSVTVSASRTEENEKSAFAGEDIIKARSLPEPTVMKIDVEGAEMKTLQGFENVLRTGPTRAVYCEVHPEKLGPEFDKSDIDSFFEDVGFHTSTIAHRGSQLFVLAERK